MNEVLNQAKTCWVEVPLSTNFEEFTLPILFAPDDDFNDYFAAMDRLHKRQSRALGGMRQHCVRARRALSENRHGDAIVHLEDHCKARKQVFAAADYQVVAAEVHIVFTAQHFGALLLAEGKSDDAHVMLSVAAEKLRDVFHAEAATELRTAARPNDEGPARAARQRQRAVRMRALLLLSHNTASFWVRRGKWAAAQQHALRAAAVARDLAAPWLAPTCDATEAAPARALVALLDARAYVCLCNAPQPGIHHNKKLHELIHWLREDPEIVRMKTSTIVIPGLVQSSKVKQMRGGGRSDPWQLLSEQPMNVVACSSSGLRNCSADPWFIGATAEFVAVSALAVDCIKTRQFDTAEKFVAECRDILQDPSQPQPVNPHWHHLVDMYAVTAQQGRERDVAATFKMDPGCTRGAVPLATQRFVRRYVEGRRAEKHRQHIEEKWIHRKIAEDESGELEELPMSELRERFALPKTAVERALQSDGMAEHAALFESTKRLTRKAQGQPVPLLWDHVTSLVERNKERSPRRTGSPRARARRNRGLNASGEGATAGGEGSPFDDRPPTGLESPLFHGADTEASLAPHSLGGDSGDRGGRRPKQAEQSPRRPGSGRSSRGGSASPRTLGRETSRDFSGTYERDDNTAAFRSGARAKPTAALASPRSNDSPNGSRPGSARDLTSSPRRSVTSQCSDRATKSSHFLHVASSPDASNHQDGAGEGDGVTLSGRGERSVGSDDGRPRSGQSTASRRERREVEGRLRPSFTAPGAATTPESPIGDSNQPAVDQDQQHALGRESNVDGSAPPQDHLGAPGSRPGSAVGSDDLHRPPSASILKRPTSGGARHAPQSLMVADDHPEHSGNGGGESSSHPTRTSTPGEKKAKRDRSARGLSILSPPGQEPVSPPQDSGTGTDGGGRRRLLSTFTGAPVDENSALHAEVREVLAIDHRGLAARQQVLRATLPTLNPKEQTYRDIVHELSKNETALAKRRQVLARQKLMQRADAIAARAGCSQTWAELSKQRDRQRKSTAATLLAATQSNKEAATMLALSGSHGPGAPVEPSHRKTSSVHTPTQDSAVDAPQTGHPIKTQTQPAATTSPTAQIAAKTVTRQKKANATYASPSRQSEKSDPESKSSKKTKGGKAAKEAPHPRAATADPYHNENPTIAATGSGDGGDVGPGRASMLPPVRSATPPASAPHHGGVGDLDGGDVRGWTEEGVSAEEQKRLLMLAKYGGTPPVKKK